MSEPLRRFVVRSIVRSRGRLARWLATKGALIGAAVPMAFWLSLVLSHPLGGGPPSEPVLIALLATSWLGPLATLASALLGRAREVRAQGVEVHADRIVLARADGSQEAIPRSELVQGYVAGDRAVIDRADGTRVEIRADASLAEEIVASLGLGAGDRRVVFRWNRVVDRLIAAVCGVALPVGLFLAFPSPPLGALACPILAGLPWLLAIWLGRTMSERSIEVGTEAIRARGRAGTVLVRFADLADVREERAGLALVHRDGTVQRVLCDPEEDGLREAIVARIREARGLAARDREPSALGALLARAGGTFSDLRETAKKVLTAAVGFRDARVTEDEVAELLSDPAAAPEQRVAAAIALAASDEPAAAMRVRVAADACASPRLRVALEAAADGSLDEEMLEAARREAR